MSFNILDSLDRLTILENKPTWILAKCPVCDGKLTINRGSKEGAYACWTNSCHKKEGNLIRKALYRPTSPFTLNNPFIVNSKQLYLVSVVKPIDLSADVKSTDFLSSLLFVPPKQVKEARKITTYFDYIDFNIVRVDYRDIQGTKKKYIYPLHLDSKGEELRELPKSFTSVPIYKEAYIQPATVFVEGEKCAVIGQKLGLACVTFPSFAYTERYLNRYILYCKKKGLRDVLYLRDNDEAGIEKAKLVCNVLAKNEIGSRIVNVADVYSKYSAIVKYDLYDLYKDESLKKETIVTFLDNCLNFQV